MGGVASVPPMNDAMEDSTRRYVAILVAGTVLLAVACSEPLTAPQSAPKQPLAELTAGPLGAGWTAIRGNRRTEDNAQSFQFELRPQGGRFHVGDFTLDYPARAVCDPATSGYGPDMWKMPCQTLNRSLQVAGKVWVENGSTFVDFDTELRFDPSKDVYLTVKIQDVKRQTPQPEWEDLYGIWYSTRIGDVRYFINDALDNPELTTEFATDRKGLATGWVTRKIWHFSGYFVRSGRVDSEGEDGAVY